MLGTCLGKALILILMTCFPHYKCCALSEEQPGGIRYPATPETKP
jgi:hypothetical protein